jgi:hypothetical protein
MMKKICIIALASLVLLSACSLTKTASVSQQDVATMVASTVQAMATFPAATPEPAALAAIGIPVSYNNISFTIPLEVNASASAATNTDVEFPYINPSGGPMAEHVVFQITNYPVAGDAKILVFKSSDFAAYGPASQNTITALLAKQEISQPLPKVLGQNFYAQTKPVTFKNGHGVRYLTQVLTNIAPITNKDLFYYYQGVTNDGAYFVSAILPVNVPFLVADDKSDSPTPTDGIPFSFDAGANQDFSKYLNQVGQKLNETPPDSFKVSLTYLDALIESIQVAAP